MTTQNVDERVRVAHTTRGHADGLLGAGLIALGIGLAVNSLMGPFGFGAVDYPLSETLHNQTIGLDAVSLLLVTPVSLAVGILARRGHRAAPYVAVSIGAYTAYMFVQYIVGPSYLSYPRILPLQLSLFVLGWAVAFRAWYISRSTEPLLTPGRLSRRHAIALFAFAGFVILRYAPALGGVVAGDPIPPDAVGDPAMFWTIVLMDLGIFVPLSLAAGVGLHRGRMWAPGALYAAAGWFLLVTTAVAAMAITMLVNDDPHAAAGQVVMFAVTELLVIAYVTVLYRPLLRRNFAP
jgi:hypothetical protein